MTSPGMMLRPVRSKTLASAGGVVLPVSPIAAIRPPLTMIVWVRGLGASAVDDADVGQGDDPVADANKVRGWADGACGCSPTVAVETSRKTSINRVLVHLIIRRNPITARVAGHRHYGHGCS